MPTHQVTKNDKKNDKRACGSSFQTKRTSEFLRYMKDFTGEAVVLARTEYTACKLNLYLQAKRVREKYMSSLASFKWKVNQSLNKTEKELERLVFSETLPVDLIPSDVLDQSRAVLEHSKEKIRESIETYRKEQNDLLSSNLIMKSDCIYHSIRNVEWLRSKVLKYIGWFKEMVHLEPLFYNPRTRSIFFAITSSIHKLGIIEYRFNSTIDTIKRGFSELDRNFTAYYFSMFYKDLTRTLAEVNELATEELNWLEMNIKIKVKNLNKTGNEK